MKQEINNSNNNVNGNGIDVKDQVIEDQMELFTDANLEKTPSNKDLLNEAENVEKQTNDLPSDNEDDRYRKICGIRMSNTTRVLMFASGIFCCYFVFGLFQERIMRGSYQAKETSQPEKFTFALFIVLVQCVCNYIFAKAVLTVKPQEPDTTRTFYYFSSSLTYLLAMVCSNMALQSVSYPTQVVGKSAKPIPVMILGVLIGRKRYPIQKYLFVVLIVIGVVLFMFKDRVVDGSKKEEAKAMAYGIGELLLLLSLTMDGVLGAIQERMRAESSPSALQMMISTNYWASLMLCVAAVCSGELISAFEFIARHPIVILHLTLLSVCGALGQLFIFLMVSQFGPLPCSVVTTTRKFFTVLASVIIFGNGLLARQWVGAVLVFSGLFLDMFFGKSAPKPVAKA